MLARQQAELEKLEARIHTYEVDMQSLATALEHAGRAQNIARVTKLGSEYRQVETKLNTLLEEWAEVADTPVG